MSSLPINKDRAVPLEEYRSVDVGDPDQNSPRERENGFQHPREPDGVFSKCCAAPISLMVSFPLIWIGICLLMLLGCALCLLFFPITVDASISSFRIRNHHSAQITDGLYAAISNWRDARSAKRQTETAVKRSSDSDLSVTYEIEETAVDEREFLPSNVSTPQKRSGDLYGQYYRRWRLWLVVTVKPPETDIFQERFLRKLHSFERFVMADPKYTDFCWRNYGTTQCNPLDSLLPYFFPAGPEGPMTDPNVVKGVLLRLGLYVYTDSGFSATNPKSRTLKMGLSFGTPLAGFSSPSDRRSQQDHIYRQWIMGFIPRLSKIDSKLDVMYGGEEITDVEILSALQKDAMMAICSCILIFFFVWFTMGSISFGLWSLLQIALSYPLAYVFYRLIMSDPYVGVLNVISLFVMIGIGVDDIFVFANFFEQDRNVQPVEKRIARVFDKAVKATFITSITTAAAFGVNALSSIPALQTFGTFMFILVMTNWLLVILLIPPVLVVCENHIFHRFTYMRFFSFAFIFSKVSALWGTCQSRQQISHRAGWSSTYEEDEEQRRETALEDFPGKCDPDRFFRERFSSFLNSLRFYLVVFFLVCGAMGLIMAAQLKPSSDPPAFFKNDTNVGRFLLADHEGSFAALRGSISSSAPDPKKVIGCDGVLFSTKQLDACGVCDGNGSTCVDCFGVPRGNATYDVCGKCGGKNDSCLGCDGVAKSGKIFDKCGVCGGDGSSCSTTLPQTQSQSQSQTQTQTQIETQPMTSSPVITTGTPTSSQSSSQTPRPTSTTPKPTSCPSHVDACGVCGGDGKSCAGCDGVPNSHKLVDQCGICGGNGKSCVGCDGVAYSNKTFDACGVCGGNNSTCVGCDGVPNSGKVKDCNGICDGPSENCLGCDGVRGSGKKLDLCGVCAGNNSCIPQNKNRQTEYFWVVWGINGIHRSVSALTNPLATGEGDPVYDSRFDLSDPKAQQHIYRVCLTLSQDTELVSGTDHTCAMLSFAKYLQSMGINFPVSQSMFPSRASQWVLNGGGAGFADDVGFSGRNFSKSLFMRATFKTSISRGSSGFAARALLDRWENTLAQLNKEAPKTAGNAAIAGDRYVELWTEILAVRGVILGLVSSSACTMIGLIFFTSNLVVSFLAMLSIVISIVMTLGLFWLLDWTLGPIEAISISTLVGLAVDYVLHIAECYNRWHSAPTRLVRVRTALGEMGLSVVCGAVTTIAASSVLLLCRLQIFAKFGLIVSANTALSVILTLFFFCPILLMFGPLGTTGDVVVMVKDFLGKIRGRSSSLDAAPSAQHLLSATDTLSGLPTEENVSTAGVDEDTAQQP